MDNQYLLKQFGSFDRSCFHSIQNDLFDLQRWRDIRDEPLPPHTSMQLKHHTTNSNSHQSNHQQLDLAAFPQLSHHCTPSCQSTFTSSQLEHILQRFNYSSDESQRAHSMIVLQSAFIEQLCAIIQQFRFKNGRDECDLDIISDMDDSLNRVKSALKSPSTVLSAPAPSHAHSVLPYKLARRVESIQHPFATSTYETSSDAPSVWSSRSHHVSSEPDASGALSTVRQRQRLSNATQQRSKQCLASGVIELIRMIVVLTHRISIWRDEMSLVVKQVDALHAAAAAHAHAQTHAPQSNNNHINQSNKHSAPNQDISSPSSPPSSTDSDLLQLKQSLESMRQQHMLQVETLKSECDILKKENTNLHRESSDRWNYVEEKERVQLKQLDDLRLERENLKFRIKELENEAENWQGEKTALTLKLHQCESRSSELSQRTHDHTEEWQRKEQHWHKEKQDLQATILKLQSCTPTVPSTVASSVNAPAPPPPPAVAVCTCAATLEAERAKLQQQLAAREADWLQRQQARDAKEQALSNEAIRAKQGHRSALKELEEMRNHVTSVEGEIEIERKSMEERLKLSNHSLSEARSLIVQLKANLKKFQSAANANSKINQQPKDEKKIEETQQKEKEKDQEEEKKPVDTTLVNKKKKRLKAPEKTVVDSDVSVSSSPPVPSSTVSSCSPVSDAPTDAQASPPAHAAPPAPVGPAPTTDTRIKKKKEEANITTNNISARAKPKHKPLPPPTALELSKPTPKLSSGYGRCVYEEGEWYEGWWEEFERHGQGVYQWKDGRRYEGEWKHDKKHGKGTYTWCDGDHYEGEYANDKMHGFGVYSFSDGTRYEGAWEQDMSHGYGVFLYADGARYEGMFDRDQKHGPGKMFLPAGEVFQENWVYGKRVSSVNMKQLEREHKVAVPRPPNQQQQPVKGLNRIRQAAQEQLIQAALSARKR